MTKEQAIEKIKWSIHINELTKDINGSNTSINVEVLKTVLSMLEEKDKQIDLMAEYISNITDCPFESEGKYLDCEKMCDVRTDEECWKQYFENKVKERR